MIYIHNLIHNNHPSIYFTHIPCWIFLPCIPYFSTNLTYRYPIHDKLKMAAHTEFIMKGKNYKLGLFSKGWISK